MPIGWAAAGAAVIGAGASIASGAMQADATKSAAKTAANTQMQMYQQGRADQQPYMETGRNALDVAGNLAGANGPEAATAAMADFRQSPGYQFQLDQGLRAVNAGSASAGMAASGANLKALQDRGNGLAAQEFGNYYNRLSGLASLGQNAAAGVGNSGTATGSGIAQTQASAGSAQASIYGNTASGVQSALNNGANNYLYQQRTNSLYGGQGGGGIDPGSYNQNLQAGDLQYFGY